MLFDQYLDLHIVWYVWSIVNLTLKKDESPISGFSGVLCGKNRESPKKDISNQKKVMLFMTVVIHTTFYFKNEIGLVCPYYIKNNFLKKKL